MATYVPYMPFPTPQYAVGSVVPIVVRIIFEPGEPHGNAFPMRIFANGLWTESTGQQLSVNHAVLAVPTISQVVADASGTFTRSNGEVCEWVEYRYDLDTATHPTPSVDIDGNPVNFGATWAAGVYDMCIEFNGAHHGESTVQDAKTAWGYNNVRSRFILTPFGDTLYDDLPERVNLHRRAAGEKAIFDDEFTTKGQLEAGHGIEFFYRDESGDTGTPEYSIVAANRMHLIFAAKGVEATWVDRYGNETEYLQVWSRKFRFKDTPDNRFTLTPQGATGTFDSTTMQVEVLNVLPLFVGEDGYYDRSFPLSSQFNTSGWIEANLDPNAWEPDDAPHIAGLAFVSQNGGFGWNNLVSATYIPYHYPFHTATNIWQYQEVAFQHYNDQPNQHVIGARVWGNRLTVRTASTSEVVADRIFETINADGHVEVSYNGVASDNTQLLYFQNSRDGYLNLDDDVEFKLKRIVEQNGHPTGKRSGFVVSGKLRDGLIPNCHGQWEWAAAANGAFNVGAVIAGGSGTRMPVPMQRYIGGNEDFGPAPSVYKTAPVSGWYWYQCVVAGEHVNNGAAYPLARYDLFLQIARGIEPNGQLEQQLSNTVWIDYDAKFGVPIDAGGAVLTMLDSIPWSLNGSGRIWLESGQPTSFSVLLKGAGAWAGATSRVFYFRYARIELKLISTDPAQPGEENRTSYVGYGSGVGNWMNYTLRP